MVYDYTNNYIILAGWRRVSSGNYVPAMMIYSTYRMIFETGWNSDNFAVSAYFGISEEAQSAAEKVWINRIIVNPGKGFLAACTSGDTSTDSRSIYKIINYKTSSPSSPTAYRYSAANLGECIEIDSFSDIDVVFVAQQKAYPFKTRLIQIIYDDNFLVIVGELQMSSSLPTINQVFIMSSTIAFMFGQTKQFEYLGSTYSIQNANYYKSFLMTFDNSKTCYDILSYDPLPISVVAPHAF